MKRHETDGYRARALDGIGKPAEGNTIDDVKQKIDKSNEKRAKRGCPEVQYIITHYEVYTWTDEDGLFAKEETYEQAVGIYPNK